jgi:peptide/nickel transport system substrate-binding protein
MGGLMGMGKLRGRRRAMIALAAVAVVGTTVAATAVSTASGSGGATSTMTLVLNADWNTLDTQQEQTGNNTWAAAPYDRFMMLDPKGNPVPWAATPIRTSTSAITFKIRPGMKCADGHVVNAEDAYNSLKRLIEVPKRLQNYLPQNYGPGPYGVSLDRKANTVTWRTGTPNRNMIYAFTGPSQMIICPKGFQALQSDPNALDKADYGSGPFQLVSAEHNVQVVYKKRPGWKWGPLGLTGADYADQVVLKIVPTKTTELNLLETGGLDYGVVTVAGPDLDRFNKNSAFWSRNILRFGADDMRFNASAGRPFTDPALREAVATLVDRKAWNQIATGGLGLLSAGPIVPGTPCYNPNWAKLLPQTTGVDAAKAVLQKAGYTYHGSDLYKGNDPVKFTIMISAQANPVPAWEYAYDLIKKLGIDVTLDVVPQAVYATRFVTGNFDLSNGILAQSVPAPGQRMGGYYGPGPAGGGTNFANTGGGDPGYNREMRLALGTLGQTSCKHFDAAISYILKQHYLLPLYASRTVGFYRKGVIGSAWDPFIGTDVAYFTTSTKVKPNLSR